ncbi:MAG: mechanosensitive ion channel [Hydrogenophaga sp.]|uniref:mechanosensitive ion channel family protein n=1 Tax=Hydrogenophaga sp. TaxID=1904254 RepID=UPI001DF7E84B|nr:mechanosensitive ion channel domain-containing protein [Hydrogenophaga sp.]MBX3610943.1 mechanosensitive ion channel [Hydrogenophaga sp.]
MDTPTWIPAALVAWLPTLGSMLLAVAVAMAIFFVGQRLVRRATRDSPIGASVAAAIRAPAEWGLPLLAINLTLQGAPDDALWHAGLLRLSTLLVIGCLTWLASNAVCGVASGVIDANPTSVADNLQARRIQTQTRVLARTLQGLVVLIGVSLMLMTFPHVRQLGTSLLASAGLVGLVAGFAARPVLGNLIAGLQIGLSQPIRLDDVVIVENEWGVIEEITGTYVVVRIWDQRRLIVPLQYWVEKPFQNWTRSTAELIGTVFLWVDYRMPLAPLREELQRICAASEHWDKRFSLLQVTEAGPSAMQLRCLVTSASAPAGWDLRCEVREQLLAFMQREYPQYLPRQRAELLPGAQSPIDQA